MKETDYIICKSYHAISRGKHNLNMENNEILVILILIDIHYHSRISQ